MSFQVTMDENLILKQRLRTRKKIKYFPDRREKKQKTEAEEDPRPTLVLTEEELASFLYYLDCHQNLLGLTGKITDQSDAVKQELHQYGKKYQLNGKDDPNHFTKSSSIG